MLPRDNPVPAKRRVDYRPPAFLVDTLDLEFDLAPDATRVRADLAFRRNPGAIELDRAAALVLDGEQQDDVQVDLDGERLPPARVVFGEGSLTVLDPPATGVLTVRSRIAPARNVALEGLYLSSGVFCTQCEPEGFRRITYFPDRPDVLARYTVTIRGDRTAYPVLLSNGNLVAQGVLDGNRHFATWHDPHPKPSYLFALVAGDLKALEDSFTTMSGRKVALRIYSTPRNLPRCRHAMESLKRSFRWDEERFGREYDLDAFMIFCADDFNMGAMENKGLNIFNSRLVLADPDTATDDDYGAIEAVIGHEYFHNWTGNRVTCRDWFQLSLKEGLTVFRDQEFSSDLNSRAVERIAAVEFLRREQFPEDAGPMAHNVRPDEYLEINNFYTSTVYEKGAEIIRMQHTLLGAERFRRGMDLYFKRHDGQAVTCDDFAQAMQDASRVDLSQFRRWYSQAGTPVLDIRGTYDADKHTYTLDVAQSTPPTPGQPVKAPFHIPLAVGLVGPDGRDIPLKFEGDAAPVGTTRVLDLREARQQFRFTDIPERPVPSLLRGFSAPVTVHFAYSADELAFLAAHDSDPVNRWDAAQKSFCEAILAHGARRARRPTAGGIGHAAARRADAAARSCERSRADRAGDGAPRSRLRRRARGHDRRRRHFAGAELPHRVAGARTARGLRARVRRAPGARLLRAHAGADRRAQARQHVPALPGSPGRCRRACPRRRAVQRRRQHDRHLWRAGGDQGLDVRRPHRPVRALRNAVARRAARPRQMVHARGDGVARGHARPRPRTPRASRASTRAIPTACARWSAPSRCATSRSSTRRTAAAMRSPRTRSWASTPPIRSSRRRSPARSTCGSASPSPGAA